MRRSSILGANADLQHQAGADNCGALATPRGAGAIALPIWERVQLHTALQSAAYCKQTLTVTKDSHFGTEEDQRASAANMVAKILQ